MTPLDDTLVMSDDTDVMPAWSLPAPPGEPARRPSPSGRRRANTLLAAAAVVAAVSLPPLAAGAPAVPVLRVMTSNVGWGDPR